MRPAYSVILFSTLSGAGYGLLAVLGTMLLAGAPPGRPLAALAVGLFLASVGLIASTFHLGRPERAWRAFSQWRTSWLSREGVAAMAVYAAALPVAGLLLWQAPHSIALRLFAAGMAVLAVATVWCTAMIYASIKPVQQWRHPAVPAAFLLLALASGVLILEAAQRLTGAVERPLVVPALVALVAAWATKEGYWHAVDHGMAPPTVAAAIGLDRYSEVRPLDPPHTESNYLLHEFGYRVGRRHAAKLRHMVRVIGFAVPVAASLAILLAARHQGAPAGLALIAALAALAGIAVERWLFFAEARHTVSLYYPAPR